MTCHLCGSRTHLTTVTAWDRQTRHVCQDCRNRAVAIWRQVPQTLRTRAAGKQAA